MSFITSIQRITRRLLLALATFLTLAFVLPGFAFAQTLISQGKPTVASSVEATYTVNLVNDGNATTRWGSAFTNTEWIYVDLGASYNISRVVLNWEAAYGSSYQIQVSSDASNWTSVYSTTTGNGATDDLTLAGTGRYVRVYGTNRATVYGYSLYEFQVYGTPVNAPVLVSSGKPAIASSQETTYPPSLATDGNLTTRWGSAFTNTEWIYVDLGASYNVSRVVLNWEAAYATAYQIQVSNDASNWTSIYSTTTGNGASDDLNISGAGRYVRVYATNRASINGSFYGFSLYEFQVYGVQSNNSSSSGSSSSTGGACNTLPNVPSGVAATGVTSTGFILSWATVNGTANCPITGYRVYRNGTQVATATATNTTINGLTASTNYSFTVAATNAFGVSAQSSPLSVSTTANPVAPDFGANVTVFDTTMSQASIQSKINSLYAIQQNNQFGPQRTAIMFKPGTYNVDIPLGFYTQVVGLGALPDDVNITNMVHSDPYLDNNNATCNFWRSVENFSVSPSSSMKWAVSQANPFRRMHVRNQGLLLHANNGWASGGWISDSKIDGTVESGSQQQWYSRNTQWGGWTGSAWNMVFQGITNNLPSGSWPNQAYTFINNTPIVREKPFLYLNGSNYEVYVPALRTNSIGISWSAGQSAGTSISLEQFYVARPGDSAATINAALSQGKHLLLTPGVYDISDSINITRADTIVLGMGFATLRPSGGKTALAIADVDGVKIAHVMVDAGTTNSPVLIQVGPSGSNASHSSNPTVLSDVFVRIGGATSGKATVSLQINSNDVVTDHIWMWRADHGTGAGWNNNTAQNGLVVNGNNVTAYGLFVEHYQQYEVLWNGNGGRTYFFQNELPYDPPNQGSWMNGGSNGWAAYKVANTVTSHEAWGMGMYAVFTQNVPILLSNAIEAPNTPNVKFHHMVITNFIQMGGISNVINNTGGSSTTGAKRVNDYP